MFTQRVNGRTAIRTGLGFCAMMLWTLAGMGTTARATPIIFVDQEQLSTDTMMQIGIGRVQTFTASRSALDAVEWLLAGSRTADGLQGSLKVDVRSGGPIGSIIGSSQVLTVPDAWVGNYTAHFDFTSPITLTPGQLYGVEISYVDNAEMFELRLQTGDAYPAGAYYTHGGDASGLTGTDAWFRVGETPEPGSLSLVLLVGVFMGRRRHR